MQQSVVQFRITSFDARVAEGVVIQWQGEELNSGPLKIELDETANTANGGFLDYGKRRARAKFQVLLSFPELASLLETLGAEPELRQPLCDVICSEGQIVDDHNLRLSGPCKLAEHPLLNSKETLAFVLPGN
jgi:hypothetical protein